MNNENTVKVKVKLEGLDDVKKQIEMMTAEFEKLKFMASKLQESLDKMSFTFDKLYDDDRGNASAE